MRLIIRNSDVCQPPVCFPGIDLRSNTVTGFRYHSFKRMYRKIYVMTIIIIPAEGSHR